MTGVVLHVLANDDKGRVLRKPFGSSLDSHRALASSQQQQKKLSKGLHNSQSMFLSPYSSDTRSRRLTAVLADAQRETRGEIHRRPTVGAVEKRPTG